MLVLTEAEKQTWFPELDAQGDALTSLLYRAQSYAQGPNGANRELSAREYTHTVEVLCGSATLPMWPVTTISSIRIRNPQDHIDRWGRQGGGCDWTELEASAYEIEQPSQLCLNVTCFQAQVTYTAGWDFSETDIEQLGHVQITIKSSLVDILRYQQGPQFCGLTEDKDLGVKFAPSARAGPGELPDHLYLPFRQYRPFC